MFSHIGNKIFVLIVAGIIIPLGLLNIFIYKHSKTVLKDQIYATLSVTSGNIQTEINSILNTKENRIHDFSSDGFIISSLESLNHQPQQRDLINMLTQHLLKNKTSVDKDITDIFLFNKEGGLVASTNPMHIRKGLAGPAPLSQRVYDITIGDIESHFGVRQFTISSPVINQKEGEVTGTVTISFIASVIDRILKDSLMHIQQLQNNTENRTREEEIYIVNRDKTIIAGSSLNLLGRHADTGLVSSTVAAGVNTVMEFDGILGPNRIGGTAYIKKPQWVVVSSLSKDLVYAPVNRLLYITTLVTSVWFGLALMLAAFVTRKFSRPILEIAKVTNRFSEGYFNERVLIKNRNDEISELGNAFNYMAGKLEASIKDLKNRKKKIRESESKYRVLLENLPQKIFLKDIDSTYISCNENYAKYLGISPIEIAGRTDFDFYPEELAEKYQTDDKRIIKTGTTEELEEKHIVAGMEFAVKTIKTPVRDEEGNIKGILGIFWDISEEKHAEKEKTELEDQLRQMQKMEAVSQLTSGIAHDFNNMLTAIIGNGYILQMKMGKESALMTYVDDILSTSERATHLTRRLLTFSRKQIIDIKPVVLHDVINNVERLLLQVIGEDIDLKINLSHEDIAVMADIGQMEQVFMNLAANARDAMPEGGLLSICTRVINLDDRFVKIHSYGLPGKYALITVSDTGTGIDKDVQKRIFEPFFTTKEIGKGTGLGLSIVYGIIKHLNGYVNVYSEQGKGATFKIYLPIVQSAVEETGFKKTLPIPAGGTETILLSEDETEVRTLTKTVLQDFGYNVIEACDGEEAIARFREYKNEINLLIFDVIMPKKNGKEAYNEIIKLRPDIKTIFTSGYNEDIIHKKGVLEDGINFILKPFVPAELLRKVREVLDNPP